MPLDTYKVLRSKTIKHQTLLDWILPTILKRIKKGIKLNQSLHSPWCIKVKFDIHKETFAEVFRAIADYSVKELGVICNKKRNKNNIITSYSITFPYLNSFTHHFRQLSNKKLNSRDYLQKKLSNQCKGEVYASPEKPILMNFKVNTAVCELKLFYKVQNQFGNLISF